MLWYIYDIQHFISPSHNNTLNFPVFEKKNPVCALHRHIYIYMYKQVSIFTLELHTWNYQKPEITSQAVMTSQLKSFAFEKEGVWWNHHVYLSVSICHQTNISPPLILSTPKLLKGEIWRLLLGLKVAHDLRLSSKWPKLYWRWKWEGAVVCLFFCCCKSYR